MMLRLRGVVKYVLFEYLKAVLYFYIAMVLIIAFWAAVPVLFPGSNVHFNGIEASTPIFLFVIGLVSFKSSYLFLQANGITRRQYYLGAIVGMVAVTLLTTATDAVLGLGSTLFMNGGNRLPSIIYPGCGYAAGILWSFAFSFFTILCGWLITMLYYRSGKWLKLLISFSPAIALAIVIAMDAVTSNGFSSAIGVGFSAAMGVGRVTNILLGICSLLITSVIAAGLCFLLVRRAPVKEQAR